MTEKTFSDLFCYGLYILGPLSS